MNSEIQRTAAEEEAVRQLIRDAYERGMRIKWKSADDPLGGWGTANDNIAQQGFMWDDWIYQATDEPYVPKARK